MFSFIRGDESETIVRLTSQLTQKSVEFRGLELRFNHISLQNAALMKEILTMRTEINRLKYEVELAEDDKRLLQVFFFNIC